MVVSVAHEKNSLLLGGWLSGARLARRRACQLRKSEPSPTNQHQRNLGWRLLPDETSLVRGPQPRYAHCGRNATNATTPSHPDNPVL